MLMRGHIGLSAMALAVVVGGCGGSGGNGSSSGKSLEVVEFPLDVPLGPTRAPAWKAPWGGTCWTLSTDEHLLMGSLFKRGPRASLDIVWQADIQGDGNCPSHVLATPDGGAVVVRVSGLSDTIISRVSGTGEILWQRTLTDRDPTVPGGIPAALLSTGGVAVGQHIAPGMEVVVILDSDGAELRRVALENIFVEAADKVGVGNGTRTPGVGRPIVSALAASPDGGVVFAGMYEFQRNIECGSQDDPQNPRTSSCGSTAVDGVVGRIDPAGKVMWSARIGNAYESGYIFLKHVSMTSDGGILAVGDRQVELYWQSPLHVQAVAVRYSGTGSVAWAKSFPFGDAPGTSFARGMEFIALAPRDAGAADVVLRTPNGNPCRLMRFDADGTISRLQILDASDFVLGTPGAACEAVALGPDIATFNTLTGMTAEIIKLEP